MRLDGTPIHYGRAHEGFLLDGLIAYGNADAERAARATLD